MTNSDLIRNLHELSHELAQVSSVRELYRKAVQGLLDPLGFDRAGLFLYDDQSHQLHGTWGTDEAGRLVDESMHQIPVGPDRALLQEALKDPDHLHFSEDIRLLTAGREVGRGWNAIVILQDGDRIFGVLFVDNLIHQRPLSSIEREVLALYGHTLSAVVQRCQFSDLLIKVRAQNDLKDRLFTILAHDIRGPIGNLGAMLGMAVDQPMDAADLKEMLQASRQAALQTFDLVENLLSWVRGQIDEVSVLRERFPLRRSLISVQIWLEAPAKAKKVKLIVDCHDSLSLVGDERMLETIVRNLVSNAVKFSPPGTAVILRGRSDHGLLMVEVVDQGVGMPPEKVAVLFAGQQNRTQRGTAGEGGNGLGLMFSADLAKRLGGRLEAESKPGEGSTFRLVIEDELDGEL